MSATRDLLLEIGTEELPPKALRRMSQALADGVRKGLDAKALTFDAVQPMASPRRLAVLVKALPERQPDREVDRRGPSVNIAFDDAGEPTKAAMGFARSCGAEVGELVQEERDGGVYLVYKSTEAGQPTPDLLPEIAAAAVDLVIAEPTAEHVVAIGAVDDVVTVSAFGMTELDCIVFKGINGSMVVATQADRGPASTTGSVKRHIEIEYA